MAVGTLGTAVGSTVAGIKSLRATQASTDAARVTANATEAEHVQNGTVRPGGPIVLKRGLRPVQLRGVRVTAGT